MPDFLNIDAQPKCENYLTPDKCFFSEYALSKGSCINIHYPKLFLFVFVLAGKIELITDGKDSIVLNELYMHSVGFDKIVNINAQMNSSIILLSITKPRILCDKINHLDLNLPLPVKKDTLYRSLPICPCMENFLHTVKFYLANGMMCRHLQNIKQSEWLFLMSVFYTQEENDMFFSPLIENGNSLFIAFEKQVTEHAPHVTTVAELADACNMSTKTLTRRFKAFFGTTPKQWLLSQKERSATGLEIEGRGKST